uniref:Kinase n=1 Tax=Lepisosteus oculatus TaxID=7918 RepID=W5NAT3_LEPOC
CPSRMSPALEAMQAEQQGFSAKGVLLEPFVHQVGGHSCVLRFSEQTICKPLIPREHQFYKSLPAELRRFTPQYKGVVSVSFEGDEEGNLCLIAYPLHSDAGELEKNVDPSADCEPKNKMVKWGNKKQGLLLDNENYSKERARQLRKEEKLKSHREEECEWANQSEVLRYSLEKGNVKAQFKHNPWSMKCHQQQLQRMKENAKHRNQYKFILLENLTWRYAMPCVLDLKMGTRQHGDDATEEKKANQIRKCQQSTSAIIGVRVCGMQVSRQGGLGQERETIVEREREWTLRAVSQWRERVDTDLFLSGEREWTLTCFSVERECTLWRERGHCELFLSGERVDTVSCFSVERESGHCELFLSGERVDTVSCFSVERESGHCELFLGGEREREGGGGGGGGRGDKGCPLVDVRMIDFAHTTCRHYGEDSVVHEGQDTGYIFGLQNLIAIIKELEDDSGD